MAQQFDVIANLKFLTDISALKQTQDQMKMMAQKTNNVDYLLKRTGLTQDKLSIGLKNTEVSKIRWFSYFYFFDEDLTAFFLAAGFLVVSFFAGLDLTAVELILLFDLEDASVFCIICKQSSNVSSLASLPPLGIL